MIDTVSTPSSIPRPFTERVLTLGLLVFSAGAVFTHASDWPQFLGPNRDGIATGSPKLADSFPGGSPKKLWSVDVGQGFAGPVVSSNRVVIFHRLGNQAVTEALNASTGARLWRQESPTDYSDDFGFDEGPRACPTIVEGRIYTHSADGHVECRRLEDGVRIWDVDTKTKFQSDKGFFGRAAAPLVVGGRLFLNLGGRDGAGVVAFSAETGALLWKATDDEAGYASPVFWTTASTPTVLFFNRSGLRAVEAATGKVRASHPWRARMHASVNAATPLVSGNEVLLTSSYGTGATLLRWKGSDFDTVWSGDEILSAHYATPVRLGNLLFGFHGRQESGAAIRCVDWATGKVKWDSGTIGSGTVAVAGDQLVALLESGELVIAPAVGDSFNPKVRCQILGTGLRAPFALADGMLVARDKKKLAAFDLRR